MREILFRGKRVDNCEWVFGGKKMKNKEKFAKEILDIVCNNGEVAMDKTTKKLNDCEEINCDECYFSEDNYPHNTGSCAKNFAHWANAEYKEPKIFTEREKAFITLFPEIKYLARNKNNKIFGYYQEPIKDEEDGRWVYVDGPDIAIGINLGDLLKFESIQWEDKEPTSREEILGK